MSYKIGSCSAWEGGTWCTEGALTNFPCKLRLNFFSALGVQVHPLQPLATPMFYQWRHWGGRTAPGDTLQGVIPEGKIVVAKFTKTSGETWSDR